MMDKLHTLQARVVENHVDVDEDDDLGGLLMYMLLYYVSSSQWENR